MFVSINMHALQLCKCFTVAMTFNVTIANTI